MTTNCLQIKHDIRGYSRDLYVLQVSIYFLLIPVLPVTMDQNDKILDMSLGVVFCPVFFFFFLFLVKFANKNQVTIFPPPRRLKIKIGCFLTPRSRFIWIPHT